MTTDVYVGIYVGIYRYRDTYIYCMYMYLRHIYGYTKYVCVQSNGWVLPAAGTRALEIQP